MPALDVDRAWLAAMLDGEGHLDFQSNNTGHGYGIRVAVSNTNSALIDKVRAVMESTGAKVGVTISSTKSGLSNYKLFRVSVSNHYSVLLVLEAVMPYLIRLKPRAEAILAFVKTRIAKNEERYNTPYDQHDIAAAESIRAMDDFGIYVPVEED